MDVSLLPRGLLIGLSVAAPVGPMALLCLRRTLSGGQSLGLVSGIGIASADALYGAVAAFGLTAVSDTLIDHQGGVRLIGGLYLFFLGVSTARSSPPANLRAEDSTTRGQYVAAFGSMLGLTLTNPATILSFAAIFAGYGVAGATTDAASAALLVAGVFLGSCGWWLVLTTVADRLRGRLDRARLRLVNLATGTVIGLFAVVAIASAIT
jgi:threonine/homoserine/homoserine lactone efflux protein